MPRYIEADAIVNFQFYDEEHEEYSLKAKKIIDFLEAYSEESIPTADEEKIATEYCMKRCLVMITIDSYEKLIAYYNRGTGPSILSLWSKDGN